MATPKQSNNIKFTYARDVQTTTKHKHIGVHVHGNAQRRWKTEQSEQKKICCVQLLAFCILPLAAPSFARITRANGGATVHGAGVAGGGGGEKKDTPNEKEEEEEITKYKHCIGICCSIYLNVYFCMAFIVCTRLCLCVCASSLFTDALLLFFAFLFRVSFILARCSANFSSSSFFLVLLEQFIWIMRSVRVCTK